MSFTIEIAPSREHTTIYGGIFYGYTKNRDGSRIDYKFVADDQSLEIPVEYKDAWKDFFSQCIAMLSKAWQVEEAFAQNGISGRMFCEEIPA